MRGVPVPWGLGCPCQLCQRQLSGQRQPESTWCVPDVCSVGALCCLSPCPTAAPLPAHQSASTPCFPGHCCWVMCFQLINGTIAACLGSPAIPAAAGKQQPCLGCPGTPLRCPLSWHQLEGPCAQQSPHCHQCSLSISAGTDTDGHLHLCSLAQSPSTHNTLSFPLVFII